MIHVLHCRLSYRFRILHLIRVVYLHMWKWVVKAQWLVYAFKIEEVADLHLPYSWLQLYNRSLAPDTKPRTQGYCASIILLPESWIEVNWVWNYYPSDLECSNSWAQSCRQAAGKTTALQCLMISWCTNSIQIKTNSIITVSKFRQFWEVQLCGNRTFSKTE